MPNGRKRQFAAFAASIWLAASGLPAVPAAAQTGPGNYGSCQYDPWSRGWYRMYVTHYEPCTPTAAELIGTCVYDDLTGSWYRVYITHYEPCDPPY
ncbi:MAG: hypothetical protein ABWX67_08300 [Allosphingosinicella sp.]